MYKTETFEQRNILNRIISASHFISDHLVELDGIYYHYKFTNTYVINKNKKYKIVANNGNQLKIAQL